ncbi:condensation domain-containing protein [Kutzneria chonburiensis]|uniref:Condensation domain-containing protein n=1 Tax=Kutzneria chonburiensis TaxID=1483604 RepID=A0ABV6MNA7_9PSEU|nr:condensation domain-containing protein [Kutzneria chonburiensis]
MALDGKLKALVQQRLQAAAARRTIPAADRSRPLPLSAGQRQMWVLHQIDPASPAYLMSWVLRLTGPLDVERLRRAWEEVVARHEILRTRYADDGEPVQTVDPAGRFELRIIDVAGGEDRARQIADWERTKPFDLTAQHPVRVTVLRVDPELHLVVVTIHHIACDAVSYQQIAAEVSAVYTGRELSDVDVQYADFAAWEIAAKASGALRPDLDYWRDALADVTELPLPLDRARTAKPDWRGGVVDVAIKPATAEAVLALAAEHRASPYMVLLAAYHALLAKISGSDDVTVGVPVSARTVPELDDLIGYLVNTVVVRSWHEKDQSFADLLTQVRECFLDALDHRTAPFVLVVDEVNPARGTGTNPLFQAGFDMDAADQPSAFRFEGLRTEELGLSAEPAAKFDLTLHVLEGPGTELSAVLEYAAAVIDETTARGWAAYFEALFDAVIADAGEPLAQIHGRLLGLLPERRVAEIADAAPQVSVPAELLAGIHRTWCEVLATDNVDVRDNFFDVGGDSLRAVALAGKLKADGLDVSAADIFEHQTIEELAQACAAQQGPSEQFALVEPFAQITAEDRAALPDDVVDAYPLAAMQLGMLIELRARPDVNTYQDSTSYLIRDEVRLDTVALQQAVQLVVDRHEVLRTTFDLNSYSTPLQLVHRKATIAVGLHHHQVGPDGWLPEMTAFAAQERGRSMDLAVAPLIRVAAHTSDDSPHWWITITECHPVLEGWSFHTMLMEILTGYQAIRGGGTPVEPDPVPFRYADYIASEAAARQSERDRDYWRGVVEGRVDAVLPSAWRDGPETPRDRYQHMVDFRDLDADLRRLASVTRTSMKAVLLAAHLKVMSMISGRREFFTGLVCDARPEVVGADRVLGMYLNTLPFPMPGGVRTWGELVRAVYDGLTGMWPHRVFPMQVIQQEADPGGRLLEVFFNYLDFHQVDRELIEEDRTLNDNDNEFALHVFTIVGLLKLNTTNHCLSRAAADRLVSLYRTVLEEMSLGPDGSADAPCLPAAELRSGPEQVLDDVQRPVATGVVGELWGPEGRTGELARFRDDGTVEKLGPIEAVELYRTRELLDAQPSVSDSFVLLRNDKLIGYVRVVEGAAFDEDALRRALAAGRLARTLIPDVLIRVEDWPLTADGAVDRDRLPAPVAVAEPAGERPWDDEFEALLRNALDTVGFQGKFTADVPLSDSGLGSFGTVGLLVAIEQNYGITIPDDFQIVDMFRTPRSLWDTIATLVAEVSDGA